MKQIIKNLIEKDFLTKNEIDSKDFSTDFEHFCNYSILSKEFNNQFDVIDVSTGQDFQGIDGIGIIANNIYIENIQQLKDLIDEQINLKVSFVFIQSKTTEGFNSGEMLNFGNAVKDFFSENPKLTLTPEVKNKLEIKNFIFDNWAVLMNEGEPVCNLYYVTLGKNADSIVNGIAQGLKSELENLQFFSSVKIELLGANDIRKLYSKIVSDDEVTFSFVTNPVSLPDITDIDEAYWGLVKFTEFKKIIIDEDENIKNVFEDNVRDYQEGNPVNKKIDETLKHAKRNVFPVLNNGVTIVADKKISSKGGTQFTIKNYQIVNGCQTSYTLYHNRELLIKNDINIPVKLIFTDNEDLKNQIIVATNSQTKIEDEQLLALLNFQKNLEKFYTTQTAIETLYYERRNGQFNTQPISKTKIVTKTDQLKAISSMFLHLPHLASGYKGRLFKQAKDKLFDDDHKFLPYYTSALCLYKLNKAIRNGNIDRSHNKARYHILMLLKLLIIGIDHKKLNSRKIEDDCNKLLNTVKNESLLSKRLKAAIELIKVSKIKIDEKGALYTDNNTNLLIDTFKASIVKKVSNKGKK